MCTFTKTNPKIKIAKKDIVVYKILNPVFKEIKILGLFKYKTKKIDHFVSIYTRKEYFPGVLYKTELDPFTYSYINSVYASCRGFYSYKDKDTTNVKCIIPKGAKYYLAHDIDYNQWIYHSNKIKIVSLI